eukprot:89842_1
MDGPDSDLKPLISSTEPWAALKSHAASQTLKNVHLGDLLKSDERNMMLAASYDGIYLDFSHQRVTDETMTKLFDLAECANVQGKIADMAAGSTINSTEGRAVMHIALRANPDEKYCVDGKNVVPLVHDVLANIKEFSEMVRSGKHLGATGKALKTTLVIGIGGSFLGSEFVYEALKLYKPATKLAKGREIVFLANVDPTAVAEALFGLDARETLVVVVSKTFTTAETMLNARTVREWLVKGAGPGAVKTQFVAVSSNPTTCAGFGVAPEFVFDLWPWVGGRYSVCSAVGMLPLALCFGFETVKQFLDGARSVDQNFLTAPPRENLALIMALLGVWNSSFLDLPAHAIIPYCEPLKRFPAHIQQVDMESNGKRVTRDGQVLDFSAGEIIIGEPGTNSQHSFFQMIHQGRVIPCDFIGFCRSQRPISLEGEEVTNHDELMSNFFAQPDALALGRDEASLAASNTPAELVPHKIFSGNRPSLSLLLPELTPYTTGQLLALYEHRVAAQGFLWGVNSFDQFGVELGKVMGKSVRIHLNQARAGQVPAGKCDSLSLATQNLLKRYLDIQTK